MAFLNTALAVCPARLQAARKSDFSSGDIRISKDSVFFGGKAGLDSV